MIKVSVIVPVYNAEKYLRKCLDSLLCQSLKEIEVIAVNDGSPDNCMNILDEYQMKYPQLKVIDNVINKGIGYSRNIGIEAAEGEYLTFVDSDDYVNKTYCKKFYEYAKENDLDFVSSNMYLKKPGSTEKYDNEAYEISDITESPDILFKMTYGPCNKLFKTSIIKDNNIRFEEKLKYEDLPFVAKAQKHSRFGFLNEYHYYYVVHEGSQTTTLNRKSLDILKILKIVNEYYDYKPYAELEMMNIKNVTWHMLLQREQPDDKYRDEYLDKAFNFLDMYFPKWRSNKYYKKESIKTRFVKSHKLLMMLYCRYWRSKNA